MRPSRSPLVLLRGRQALTCLAFASLTLGSAALVQGALGSAALAQGAPNAPDQHPAFAGQTRAPSPAAPVRLRQEVVAEGLPQLWALEFLPDGRMLVTAKAGALHIIGADGRPGPAIAGLPEVDARGQGGLLDVALAPDFARSGRLWLSYSEPRPGGNGTSVMAAQLVTDAAGGGRLEEARVIFRQEPTWDNGYHFGSRLVPTATGDLFVTVGERSVPDARVAAQDPESGLGKVFRIRGDGSLPPDNPLTGGGMAPAVWSLGHRNMQAAALDGAGRLWTVEHGPRGGDELNRPQAGRNYGWPEVTYGIDYSGAPIGTGITQKRGTEQPVYYWDPVIAPSGMAFYDAPQIPAWRGAFLVGGLAAQAVVVLHLDGERVAAEERVAMGARVRDVKVGPDGLVYAVTETRGGASRILRLAPEA